MNYAGPMKTNTRRLLLALAALSLLPAGFGANANPSTGISLDTALGDAHRLADTKAGCQVVRVEGESMLPFFGDGAVLVVKTLPAAKLRAGMVVLYRNSFGETVAHRLVAATAGGWQAQGYNNTAADSTTVSDANLLGVVYATFHSDGNSASQLAAAALAGTPVALAAPAR